MSEIGIGKEKRRQAQPETKRQKDAGHGDEQCRLAVPAQMTEVELQAHQKQHENQADLAEDGENPAKELVGQFGQSYGRYTNLGGAANLDEYELRPQRNDRFNVSFQKETWRGMIVDLSYFFNYGIGVPYDRNLNMADPAFRYEFKTLLNTQVANPFRNYLTADKFPGALRNTATVTLGSLLVPYPQYSSLLQRNTAFSVIRSALLARVFLGALFSGF